MFLFRSFSFSFCRYNLFSGIVCCEDEEEKNTEFSVQSHFSVWIHTKYTRIHTLTLDVVKIPRIFVDFFSYFFCIFLSFLLSKSLVFFCVLFVNQECIYVCLSECVCAYKCEFVYFFLCANRTGKITVIFLLVLLHVVQFFNRCCQHLLDFKCTQQMFV